MGPGNAWAQRLEPTLMAERDNLVVLFARLPQAGRVKTRLAAGVGAEPAARLYEAFTRDLLDLVAGIGTDWRVEVAGDPGAFAAHYGLAPERCIEQRGADLGERMQAAFSRALEEEGYARCVLIGSDLPHLRQAALAKAAVTLALGETDLVLGPARDGGYYLIAMARVLPIFDGIAWSTDSVLDETRRRARAAGARIGMLAEEFDIDTVADLENLADALGTLPAAVAPHTRAALGGRA